MSRVLEILAIMNEYTDEKNPLTMREIQKHLEKRGVNVDRRTVKEEFNRINDNLEVEVIGNKGSKASYYLSSRRFELAELKLLIDAVQCSQFISHKKSESLVEKISELTSVHEREGLKRQVYIEGRPKTENEQILYNVDKLHDAINSRRRVTFNYYDLDQNLQLKFRNEDWRYNILPVCLAWDNNRYYLITYSKTKESYSHYRVDRMSDIEFDIVEDENIVPELNISQYSKSLFGMYTGQETVVKIKVHKKHIEMINQIVDQFGSDVHFSDEDDSWIVCNLTARVSSTFFSWLAQYKGKIMIDEPIEIIEQYKNFLNENMSIYK